MRFKKNERETSRELVCIQGMRRELFGESESEDDSVENIESDDGIEEGEYTFASAIGLDEAKKRYVRYKIEKSEIPTRRGYMATGYKADGTWETTFGRTKRQVEQDVKALMKMDEDLDLEEATKPGTFFVVVDLSKAGGKLLIPKIFKGVVRAHDAASGLRKSGKNAQVLDALWYKPARPLLKAAGVIGESGVQEEYDTSGLHARLSRRKKPDAGRASGAAATKLGNFFKDMGQKVQILQTDGWGKTPLMIEMYGMRIPVHVGVQEMPKGTDLYVQFQSPMSGKGGDTWKQVASTISGAMKRVLPKFGAYGKATLPRNEKKWPTLWLKAKKGKELDAIQAFPNLVHKLGHNVTISLLADEDQWVEEGVVSESRASGWKRTLSRKLKAKGHPTIPELQKKYGRSLNDAALLSMYNKMDADRAVGMIVKFIKKQEEWVDDEDVELDEARTVHTAYIDWLKSKHSDRFVKGTDMAGAKRIFKTMRAPQLAMVEWKKRR